jgi:hypothetical protein
MKLGAWWMPVAALLVACGTAGSGQEELSIRDATLPAATVGLRYDDLNVAIQLERGTGSLSWSAPLLPSSLQSWLSINPDTGQLLGTPLDIVAPAAAFVVQVTNGKATARKEFSLSVGCREGVRSPCGVPDPARCVAGSRLCQGGGLRACVADVGSPPYEADSAHCGPGCDETCPRTTSNRCVGTCTCGGGTGPCSGVTPACCPGADGRPEGFVCVSLQTPEHCGACQSACSPRPQTVPGCSSSTCRYACLAPYQNCNGGPSGEGSDADGCETRVDNDVTNCGACNRRCPTGLPASAHTVAGVPPSCSGGVCRYLCDLPRFHDCSSGTCLEFTTDLDADGCETDFSDTGSCGGKGNVCPGIPNADPTCALNGRTGQYQCGLQCRAGYDPEPCDSPPVCKPLGDPENCGTCGRSCPTMGAVQACNDQGECCHTTCDPTRKPPCEKVCEPP